jgi:hypothetical protein
MWFVLLRHEQLGSHHGNAGQQPKGGDKSGRLLDTLVFVAKE